MRKFISMLALLFCVTIGVLLKPVDVCAYPSQSGTGEVSSTAKAYPANATYTVVDGSYVVSSPIILVHPGGVVTHETISYSIDDTDGRPIESMKYALYDGLKGNIDHLREYGFQVGYTEDDFVEKTVEVEKEVSKSSITRHYGYVVFKGTVQVSGALSKGAVVAALTAGHSPSIIGTADLGGGDNTKLMNGAAGRNSQLASLARQIRDQADTPDARDFFNAYGSVVGMTYEQFISSAANAGTVNVPYVGVSLAMSSGNGGGITHIIGRYNPFTVSAAEVTAVFAAASGGDSLYNSLKDQTAGNIYVSDAPPVASKYVFPFDGIDNVTSEFVFGVQSTPKDGVTDWDKGPNDRQGSFTVNVYCPDVTGINVMDQYTIAVNISKGGDGNYSGPYLSTVNVVSNEPVKVSGSRLAKGEIIPVQIKVTGDGPGDKGHMVLNKGVCQVQVTVTSTSGSANATFSNDERLNDDQSKGGGSTGYNYVGWKGSDMEEPEVEKIPWAQHSASDPMIRGTLGASEYGNEDWDLGVGVPSTENVYVLAGGESAISDLAGYFVLHSSRDFTEVSTDAQGENEPGVPASNPSVTREIMVSCEVQNTWGWDNRLCHRQAVEYSVEGGVEVEQGGGTPFNCPGGNTGVHSGSHSSPHSGSWNSSYNHCAGSHTYGNQNNVAGYNYCKWHGTAWTAGTGDHHYEHHTTCSGLTGCTQNVPEIGPPTADDTTCGSNQASGCSPSVWDHKCNWKLAVYDGDKTDSVNKGVRSADAVTLPSFTLQVNGWKPLDESSFEVINYSCSGKDIGASAWKSKVLDIVKGHDNTAYVRGSVTFTPVANQYFHLSGSFEVGNNADGNVRTKNVCITNCEHFTSRPNPYNNGGSVEKLVLSPSNGSEMLCDGYSYGTGSRCNEYENCYHLNPHKYTLKYLETIDFYVFRSVTDAHLASMRGSKITSVNQVTKSGYESGDGTYGAPMADSVVGQSSTAPESVGYLWRAVNSTYGSYVNGEGLETGNGEYNGRILFEIWKDPEASAGGALSYEFNTNFCLGNAEIKAVLLQDNKFANDENIKAQYIPTEALTSIPATVENRGYTEDRFNHDYVTSQERGKGLGAQYANKPGDCINEAFSQNAVWDGDTDDTQKSEYKRIVIAEQNAVVNFWQGKNQDDNYHATVICDSMVYGNDTNTTQVIGEYYSVDEGIPLFNYLGGTKGRSQIDNDEEGPIYRNHHSTVGSSGKELADFLIGYNSPTSPSMKEGDHYGFFGYGGSFNGGDIALAESLTGKCVEGTIYEIENGNKGSWIPGADVIDAYRRKMGAMVLNGGETNSGITEFQLYLKDRPSPGGDSFSGYWNDHEYPAHVSETIYGRYNGSSGNDLVWSDADCMFTGTNSGTLNESTYGQSLLMHNLALVDWTPNSAWPSCEISNAYGWLIDIPGGFDDVTAELYANGVYDTHKTIVANELGLSLSETIRIYDPISAENSYNLGNEYGNWSGTIEDVSEYDQRVTSMNKAKNDFAAIGNYVNTNTYLYTWIAPFGNFSSVGGSGGNGADITTADVYRNQNKKGYTDEMYIGTWTKDVDILYPFIARTSMGKVNTLFRISELDSVYGGGGSPYMEAQYGPDTIQNFWTSRENPVFKFGNAVGAINTINCIEGRDLPVTVTAYAINDGIKSSDSSCSYGYTVNSSGRNDDKLCNAASKTIPIDVVGQIGNLAIHDTTDFRFSTYFRRSTDDWLIDGIVHKTDGKYAINILAEPKDIIFDNASGKYNKHATTGATLLGDSEYRLGMSANFGLLPLTPAYITVPEFKTDAMRLGYKVYASIETIGNYQSAFRAGTKYPTNFDQAQNPAFDTRQEYMDIVSEYYLYDFDTGLFYACDLWSGPEGAKQCIYSGSDREVHAQENSEPLYINMDEEYYRRDVTPAEDNTSRFYALLDDSDVYIYTAMMSGLEFIGYTGKIRLDNMDITFIGSDAVHGIRQFSSAEYPVAEYYYDSSQRWHFTTGLTSTTVPTVPIYQEGRTLTATQVENAANSMRNKHPNAVIVEFQTYVAKGSVWTLKYKGSLMNYPKIKFYSNPEDCPYENKSHLETEYQGFQVYNPETGAPYGSQTIDKDNTPLVAYEAYKSNSEDRTVAGTH